MLKRRLVIAVAMAILLLTGLVNAATEASQPDSSAWAAWLNPQTVIATAVILLYFGGLREDLKQIKHDLLSLKAWREQHDKDLEQRFMPREALEARLRALRDGRGGHDDAQRHLS